MANEIPGKILHPNRSQPKDHIVGVLRAERGKNLGRITAKVVVLGHPKKKSGNIIEEIVWHAKKSKMSDKKRTKPRCDIKNQRVPVKRMGETKIEGQQQRNP